MFSNEIIIGIIVLAIIVAILIIRKSSQTQQRQETSQPLKAATFNAALENELSSGIDGKSLIEILGLENMPPDGQQEVIEAATRVIEMRCLNCILESLNEQEKRDFVDVLDTEDLESVNNFLRSKQIDQHAILRKEVLQFKRETAEKFS